MSFKSKTLERKEEIQQRQVLNGMFVKVRISFLTSSIQRTQAEILHPGENCNKIWEFWSFYPGCHFLVIMIAKESSMIDFWVIICDPYTMTKTPY